jgi:hypothetical protein
MAPAPDPANHLDHLHMRRSDRPCQGDKTISNGFVTCIGISVTLEVARRFIFDVASLVATPFYAYKRDNLTLYEAR